MAAPIFRCRYCHKEKPGRWVRALVAGSLFRHGAMEWVCDDCHTTLQPNDVRPSMKSDAEEKHV